jgi:hypothetical protein
MYTFINLELKKEASKLIAKGWEPTKGKISANSIEFNEDCSSYLYYTNVQGRDADLAELKKMLSKNLVN